MTLDDPQDQELVRRLRSLPREMVPPARAWARVEQRLQAPEPPARTLPRGRRLRGRWQALAALAAAASLTLLLAPALLHRPSSAPIPPQGVVAPGAVQQAEHLRGDYRQALAAMPAASIPDELQPALLELDRSAASILAAIHEAPGSLFLLDQLQRTYAQRLQLTRHAVLAPGGLSK